MITNTVQSIEMIIGQLKTINTVRKMLTILFYSGYLVYRIVCNTGYLALNIILLVLTAVYGGFYVAFNASDKKLVDKKTVKNVNKIYRWGRMALSAIGIGLNVSGFLAVYQQMSAVNLIFAIINPIVLLIQIVGELLFAYVTYCFKLVKAGITEDVQNLKEKYEKPIQAVKGVKETVEGITTLKQGVINFAQGFFNRRRRKESASSVVVEEDGTETVVTDGENQ